MRKNKILKTFIAIALLISIETAAIATSTGVVNVDTVRVREKPTTTDSKIVGLVSIGDKVTIIGEEDNWYKVKAEDDNGEEVEGYIRKDLLTVDGETGDVTPTEEPNANEDTPLAGEETPGEETPEEGGTQTGEPTSGEPIEQPTGNSDITVEKNDRTISTIKVTANLAVGQRLKLNEETKIKILPSANSSNITKLAANTEVIVLEVINSWCRIETGEYAGWVRIDQ